jgi:hypothetical protein
MTNRRDEMDRMLSAMYNAVESVQEITQYEYKGASFEHEGEVAIFAGLYAAYANTFGEDDAESKKQFFIKYAQDYYKMW